VTPHKSLNTHLVLRNHTRSGQQHKPLRPSAIWNRATCGMTWAVRRITSGLSLNINANLSFKLIIIANTTAPAMILSHAAVLAALLAPFGSRAPKRCPTLSLPALSLAMCPDCLLSIYTREAHLVEAATPIPKGIVFKTWSVVMITLWAARGTVPRRPAARATISNAH